MTPRRLATSAGAVLALVALAANSLLSLLACTVQLSVPILAGLGGVLLPLRADLDAARVAPVSILGGIGLAIVGARGR